MHSVDCIEDNAKPGAKFWGVIAESYNSTIDPHRQQILKKLKDHWCSCNKQVSLFNQILQSRSFLQAKRSQQCHGS
jgi:hypothetical protein